MSSAWQWFAARCGRCGNHWLQVQIRKDGQGYEIDCHVCGPIKWKPYTSEAERPKPKRYSLRKSQPPR